jgi:hypothetical protein
MNNKKKLPDTIVINSMRLRNLVSDYGREMGSRVGWAVPAAFFLSIALCILVSEFKPFLGFSADQVKLVIYLIGIASFLWTLTEINKLRRERPIFYFEKGLAENLINTPDFTVMYLIKLTTDFLPRILVEKNPTWNCYFLPYTSRESTDSFSTEKITELKKTISSYLAIPNDSVNIDHLRDYTLTSEKFSEKDKVQKQFNFDFFFFSIPANKMMANYNNSPLVVGGKTFYWMTLDELLNDPVTHQRNGDVLLHLQKHYGALFVTASDSIR